MIAGTNGKSKVMRSLKKMFVAFLSPLVDEIFLTICPVFFGGKSNATISDGVGIPNLSDATRFRCVEHKCIQGEMFLRYLAVKTD